MKIKKVEVSLGRTINLGNYESARIDVTLSASLEAEDKLDVVYDELYCEADSKVQKEVDTLMDVGITRPPY